ncbi:pyruvate kinase [Vibrio tubiashii]|uniref:Pyruvate kinase n=1 Tax=Vibrio tubiashii ATCC 19109 TaxID=1051646 RepID=F9T4F3_9VIBR|nr:pyruvate kinase [Vibrio tubiashii]AIW13321.1 pyruvate kinase [Vibrio tubiashii ATCC 19109]EGU56064.1 Pyruvate kinase (PYK) [Vibrio tubiashii ATCC 19109]EIF04457.1 Pyruvate kinase (PYK) [Vibrio tubiashii NCIMB 1337 = ATCC 19106]
MKIIATNGAATSTADVRRALVDSGVAIMRFNFGVGIFSHQEMNQFMLDYQQQTQAYPHAQSLADLPGGKVRVCAISSPQLALGQTVRIVEQGTLAEGETDVWCGIDAPIENLSVAIGQKVYIADGAVELTIEAVDGEQIVSVVTYPGEVELRKGISLSRKHIYAELTNEFHRIFQQLRHSKPDYIALSFVSSAEDVLMIQRVLAEYTAGSSWRPKLLAKIENQAGIDHIEAILAHVAGIIVARGDLALHVPFEQMGRLERSLIETVQREVDKEVFVATEIFNYRDVTALPSRAEISSLYGLLALEIDGIMFSSETSSSKQPLKFVHFAQKIIQDMNEH